MNDVLDIQSVVTYLKREFGYETYLIVAHSRGSIAAFHWLSTSNDSQSVGGFVNVSARYRMNVRHIIICPPFKLINTGQKIYGIMPSSSRIKSHF